MSSREPLYKGTPEVSALFLIRVFIKEYWDTLLTVVLLIALSTYAIFRSPETLLNVLVFVMLWLQLELSYRQWWLEIKRKRPILRFVDAQLVETTELFFYVENIGSEIAHQIYIVPVTVSRRMFEKFYVVLLRKGYMFKKTGFISCPGSFGLRVSLPPYENDSINIHYSYLAKCVEGEDRVLFFLICYDDPDELGVENACTEAINIEVFDKSVRIYSAKLYNEPPPGILIKLPYMLRDARMYWKMYKASERLRQHLRDQHG